MQPLIIIAGSFPECCRSHIPILKISLVIVPIRSKRQLDKKQVADVIDYLKEQTTYTMLFFNEKPVAVTAPLFMELKVIDTPPGEKGNTAQGGSKTATLETGLVLQVPLFVNMDDYIKVDTREGKYIERVKNK